MVLIRMMPGFYVLPLCLSLTAVQVSSCGWKSSSDHSLIESLQEPRPLPQVGPWFEGWYTRVTSTSSDESFAIIVASVLGEDVTKPDDGIVPGYVSVLHQKEDELAISVDNVFPEETQMLTEGGRPVVRNPSPFRDRGFVWSSPGLASQTEDRLEVALDDGGKYTVVRAGDDRGWDFADLGPAGLGSLISVLPLQWYVHSTATPVEWTITDSVGHVRTGQGLAHFEKNWGDAFPGEWVWGQATSRTEDVQLAFAGGPPPGLPVSLGAVIPKVFLIGLRDGKEFYSFKPQELGTVFELDSKPCEGKLRLLVQTPTQSLEIYASADPQTFSPLAIPTKKGFVEGAQESFRTTYTVRIYSHAPFAGFLGMGDLQKEIVIPGGALEFGGQARCSGG